MKNTPSAGLVDSLRPDNIDTILIDHEPFQFMNLKTKNLR
ncbi:hypothetical protein SPPR111872_12690 [Sphingobacterium prati]